MGKRSSDIKALIRRGEIDLKKIEQAYASALYQKIIPSDLQIDIKNFCENQRSVLDYLAHDIREMCCPGANSTDRFYFPICGDARQFEGDVAKSYPGLKAVSPDLWGFLESIQPYHSEWSWLGAFNKLNNENKHGRLVAQKRQETPQVQHHAMEVVSSAGCRIKFGSARAFASMASQSIPGPKCPCQTLR